MLHGGEQGGNGLLDGGETVATGSGEEAREIVHRGGHQAHGAPGGTGGDAKERLAERFDGERERSGVEIGVRESDAVDNGRVVVAGVEFEFDEVAGAGKGVRGGAVDRREDAEAERVLQAPGCAGEVEVAPGEESEDLGGGLGLAGGGPEGGGAGVERGEAAAEAFERERSGDQAGVERAARVGDQKRGGSDSGGVGGDEGETVLRAPLRDGNTGLGERIGGGQEDAVPLGMTLAGEECGDVGERDEIGLTDRADRGDRRGDATLDHREQGFRHPERDAGRRRTPGATVGRA